VFHLTADKPAKAYYNLVSALHLRDDVPLYPEHRLAANHRLSVDQFHKGRVLVIDFIILKYIYKNYINIQIIICQYYFESKILHG